MLTVHHATGLPLAAIGLLLAALLGGGCHHATAGAQQGHLHRLLHAHHQPAHLENPMFVPQCEREFVWQQLVDSVDTYFKIEREDRMRVIGDAITEGRIYTYPETAATCLEPWRRDSGHGQSRLAATLQTLRRQAMLRLVPTEGGYLVEVVVNLEKEDLDRPEQSTVAGASLRHDGTITRQQRGPDTAPIRLGWIPLGRDTQLEQRLLGDIRSRLAPAYTGVVAQ